MHAEVLILKYYISQMNIREVDIKIINFFRKFYAPISRLSLFVVFFWFGFLKAIGLSPAEGMVKDLLGQTMPFISPGVFVMLFGLFEMLIGILFVIKGMERVVVPMLAFHMVTTFLPLIFLPSLTWSDFLVPTLEGQYIIKNLVVIACAFGVASNLHPLKKK